MIDETKIGRELAQRAEDVHGSQLSFEDVRGRAGQIRRRRAIGVAGGVATAIALVVLVPTVLIGGSGTKTEAPDPAPSAPMRHTAVLHDGTLTLPDGGTVPLDVDNADVNQVGLMADGRIVLAMNRQPGVQVFRPDGTFQDEYVAGPTAIEMSPDGRAAAWIEGDGSVQVLASGQEEPTELGSVGIDPDTGAMIDAVVDAEHVLVGDGNTTTTEVTVDRVESLQTSEPLRVTDVSPDGGLWAVQYADDADPMFGCTGLYDPVAGTMVARSCDTAGLRFSPDGQHLLGMRGDNGMYSDASVLDLELHRVGGFVPQDDGEVIKEATWADEGHLLVSETNWKTSTWSLAEVDLAWSDRKLLDGPAKGRNPEMVSEYLLSE